MIQYRKIFGKIRIRNVGKIFVKFRNIRKYMKTLRNIISQNVWKKFFFEISQNIIFKI